MKQIMFGCLLTTAVIWLLTMVVEEIIIVILGVEVICSHFPNFPRVPDSGACDSQFAAIDGVVMTMFLLPFICCCLPCLYYAYRHFQLTREAAGIVVILEIIVSQCHFFSLIFQDQYQMSFIPLITFPLYRISSSSMEPSTEPSTEPSMEPSSTVMLTCTIYFR